jgi:hypothetical protein
MLACRFPLILPLARGTRLRTTVGLETQTGYRVNCIPPWILWSRRLDLNQRPLMGCEPRRRTSRPLFLAAGLSPPDYLTSHSSVEGVFTARLLQRTDAHHYGF